MTRRQFLATTTGAVALARLHGSFAAHAGVTEEYRVRMVAALRSTTQSLGWIGTEAGMFKRLGIDVSFPALETAGPEAAAGLVRGDWDFAEVGGAPIVQNVLQGHDSVILLAALTPQPLGPFLLARRGITEPGQLSGARVGVLTETGQNTIGARAMLRKWGVSATLVPLGTLPKVYAALAAQEIDAGVLSTEYRLAGQRLFGLTTLADLGAELGFQPPVLASTRRLIAVSRGLAARVVQGYVETIHLFKTNRPVVLPLLQRYLKIFDRETIGEIHEIYAARLQSLPRPSLTGIQKLLDEFAPRYPAARTLPPTAVTDMSFLEHLERSGFVARLYGG